MQDTFNKERLSVEEYLSLEGESLERHEYLQGIRREMSGSTVAHSGLVGRVLSAIHFFLRESEYDLFHLQIKLRVAKANFIAYPDLMIVKKPERWNERDDTISNADVIIEISTEKTEACDYGEKFKLYCGVPSLKEYIVISSTNISVERHLKQSDGFWVFNEITNANDLFRVETIGFVCPLNELYKRVEF